MSVTFAQHPTGPRANAPSIQAIASSHQQALAQALQGVSNPIVIDAAEGEGRSLASIASFIQSGGIWISWGGYPFYYTPSQPTGLGFNFSRFCQLLGVPDPNAANAGGEFFGPAGGSSRVLWTPSTTTTLPAPWIAGAPLQVVSGQNTWPLIAVPSGSGWWFYADQNITPAQYAAFILSLTTPPVSSTATPARSIPWGWIIGGGIAALGVGTVLVVERRH